MKMQTSLSMRGVVEGLRELLEELEWCEETSAAYQFYTQRLKEQEARELQYINEAIKWLEQQIKIILNSLSKDQQLSDLIEPIISKELLSIHEGNSCAPTYLQAMINLLQRTANTLASYGKEQIIKNFGIFGKIQVSLPPLKDPLQGVEEERIVEPFSVDGEKIQKALGGGFIKAKIF